MSQALECAAMGGSYNNYNNNNSRNNNNNNSDNNNSSNDKLFNGIANISLTLCRN